ncbi:hypothetical protein D3H65_12595 [Paraflavitalea soli]|uniref:TonB-dependent receptor plug domain-containing protein n=1 Tax=Paraflavitalea soli TaxID=2315862 RepID=A0A3B7MWL2_9BACT|nr:hypothetical protein [Paraflavitalea soli]AXY74771.1 hypothetical protein D3H65_12595 [Paraflavitalea soli]
MQRCLFKWQVLSFGILCLVAIANTTLAQDTTICLSMQMKDATLERFFELVKDQSDFKPVYGTTHARGLRLITYQANKVPLYRILDTVLGRLGLGYRFNRNFICLHKDSLKVAQFPVVLWGKVTDHKGEPLGGISVQNISTNQYVITSQEGFFELAWPPGSLVVGFSGKGWEGRSMNIVEAGQLLQVLLDPLPATLQEVVIKGYYETTRRDNTGSVIKVKGTDLQASDGNVLAALQGRVPGLLITQVSGAPGSSAMPRVGGRASIGSKPGSDNLLLNEPLQVWNNMPLSTGSRPVTHTSSAAGDPQAGSGGSVVKISLTPMILNPLRY